MSELSATMQPMIIDTLSQLLGLSHAQFIGAAVLTAVAAWVFRSVIVDKTKEKAKKNWRPIVKYALIVGGGWLIGRRLGTMVGNSPSEWVAFATALLTHVSVVITLVGGVLVLAGLKHGVGDSLRGVIE